MLEFHHSDVATQFITCSSNKASGRGKHRFYHGGSETVISFAKFNIHSIATYGLRELAIYIVGIYRKDNKCSRREVCY